LNWEEVQLRSRDLSHLEDEFTEEEVFAVIRDLAAEKAPGPDGYIGVFYKTAWNLIKDDIYPAGSAVFLPATQSTLITSKFGPYCANSQKNLMQELSWISDQLA
jgi:hypothetical protein